MSTTGDIPDGELVKQALQAQDAFDTLVERYYYLAYAIALSRVGQRETAEEVAQETFLRVYLRLRDLRQPERFGSWVGSIARNLAEDWRARGQGRSRLVAMVPLDSVAGEIADTHTPSAREQLESKEEAAALTGAVMRLTEQEREIVLLHFVGELSKSDIARRQGVNPSTVGRQLDRALGHLRADLGDATAAAGKLLRPSRDAARRAAVLVAAAAALPHAARAAIETAAAEMVGPTLAALDPSAAAIGNTGSLVHRFCSTIMSGGETMLILKGVGVVAVIAAIAGSGFFNRGHIADQGAETARAPGPMVGSFAGTDTTAHQAEASKPQAVGEAMPVTPQAPATNAAGAAASPSGVSATDPGNAPRVLAQAPAGGMIAPPTPPQQTQTKYSVRPAQAASGQPGQPDMDAIIRDKVSRTRSDLRSMATAVESYMVDYNAYPACDPAKNMRGAGPGTATVSSFATPCLTTPVAYITTYPADTFGDGKQTFGYYSVKKDDRWRWVMFSAGVDGTIDYDWRQLVPVAPPSADAVLHIYDPTNGTISAGDIIRVGP